MLGSRHDLLSRRILGQCVFMNAAPFLRVADPRAPVDAALTAPVAAAAAGGAAKAAARRRADSDSDASFDDGGGKAGGGSGGVFNPLDATRIPPFLYALAAHICEESLDPRPARESSRAVLLAVHSHVTPPPPLPLAAGTIDFDNPRSYAALVREVRRGRSATPVCSLPTTPPLPPPPPSQVSSAGQRGLAALVGRGGGAAAVAAVAAQGLSTVAWEEWVPGMRRAITRSGAPVPEEVEVEPPDPLSELDLQAFAQMLAEVRRAAAREPSAAGPSPCLPACPPTAEEACGLPPHARAHQGGAARALPRGAPALGALGPVPRGALPYLFARDVCDASPRRARVCARHPRPVRQPHVPPRRLGPQGAHRGLRDDAAARRLAQRR